MYDNETDRLIRSAPSLAGFDIDKLPKLLTEAYARISAAKIQILEGVDKSELNTIIATLKNIALTYESFAALLPDHENRASAAFVAASAHQVILQARDDRQQESYIGMSSMSSDISATLLFLLSDAHADASEAAKRICSQGNGSAFEFSLIEAIRNLALGKVDEIISISEPDIDIESDNSSEISLDILRLWLLRGVIGIANQLYSNSEICSSRTLFEKVISLSTHIVNLDEDENHTLLSTYAGPLHLACFLRDLEKKLLDNAVIRIKPPEGVDKNRWEQYLSNTALQRPYIWRNHLDAINKGCLEVGISSAISFPTGGGKSTIAELKIKTMLLQSRRVIFLTPTHALVDQTQKSLEETLGKGKVGSNFDDDVSFSADVDLSDVTVMTPECCLMLISIDQDAFSDVGLIVFDECHLIHPRGDSKDRRAIDAMFVILRLTQIAPDADLLLLSAMMKNAKEISKWINHLTGRKCLALDIDWKPTRQIRGCVVYSSKRIKELNAILRQARIDYPNQKTTPAEISRSLNAYPYGLISLLQTWATVNIADYILLQLLSTTCPLSSQTSKSGNWYLTANSNEVSLEIAKASSSSGMKTLVFVQQVSHCEKCVRSCPDDDSLKQIQLTEEEQEWRRNVEEELGGSKHCYLNTDSECKLKSKSVSHHGLLLAEERRIHESLFKRQDGAMVMFATSTVAQGMNLPSEVVIISGDSRFDYDENEQKILDAHELLNAAGRAGRAGQNAQGVVLLVPSRVVNIDERSSRITDHWMTMKAIFEQSDQCLEIDDPVFSLVERILNDSQNDEAVEYFLCRLPILRVGDTVDPAADFISRSLCAYRFSRSDYNEWLSQMLFPAISSRKRSGLPDSMRWIENVAGVTGMDIDLLQNLYESILRKEFQGTPIEVLESLLDWIYDNYDSMERIFHAENLERMLDSRYKNIISREHKSKYVIWVIRNITHLWMSGVPLCEIESNMPSKKAGKLKCEGARIFALRVVPDLSFIASLPGQLISAKSRYEGSEVIIPSEFENLSRMVRNGCDSIEILATKMHLGDSATRVQSHRYYNENRHRIPKGLANDTLTDLVDRIDIALSASDSSSTNGAGS